MDLGYNVLNNEALRRSLGFSVESLEDTASEDEVIIASATGRQIESLPVPEALVTDKDFKVSNGGGDNHNVWSDEKFWGSGPSPFFFPNIFAPPRPSAAVVRPFRGHLPIQSQHPPSHPLHSSHPPRQKTSPAHPKFFVGDQHQCGTGSCEFVLFCWLSGGIIDGACGGFLYACCLRPDGGRNSEVIATQVSLFWTIFISKKILSRVDVFLLCVNYYFVFLTLFLNKKIVIPDSASIIGSFGGFNFNLLNFYF